MRLCVLFNSALNVMKDLAVDAPASILCGIFKLLLECRRHVDVRFDAALRLSLGSVRH